MKRLEIKSIAFLLSVVTITSQLLLDMIELPFPFHDILNLSTTEKLLATLVLLVGYFVFKDILMVASDE